jgi:hypothetical protein
MIDSSDGTFVAKVYWKRWLVLAIFSVNTLANAILWISFASISDFTSSYFGITTTQVNALFS